MGDIYIEDDKPAYLSIMKHSNNEISRNISIFKTVIFAY